MFLLSSGISTTKFARNTYRTNQYFAQNYLRTCLYFLLLSTFSIIIFLNNLPSFPISTIINRSSKFVFPISECLGPGGAGGNVYDHQPNVNKKSHYINQNIVLKHMTSVIVPYKDGYNPYCRCRRSCQCNINLVKDWPKIPVLYKHGQRQAWRLTTNAKITTTAQQK